MVQAGILLEFRDLCLSVVCGEDGLQREIRSVDLNRPGMRTGYRSLEGERSGTSASMRTPPN
jgi:serine kinase of HPr protein (carbohydrate metabolism regulator)